ncbi:unnamed protein product, partial [Rotaria sp. Silwood1]
MVLIYLLINSLGKYLAYPDEQHNQPTKINYSNFIENGRSVKIGEDKSANNDILLIYIYAGTHSHAYGNLKYFIDKCVRQGDHVDYYFILQQVDNKPINESDMPLLTSNSAYYIQHENKCFDFGTVGW